MLTVLETFIDHDLLTAASGPAIARVTSCDSAGAIAQHWLDLRSLRVTTRDRWREGGSLAPAGKATPARGVDLSPQAAPWSSDHLLADATGMNDEYVSLQVSPVSGHLYAVFAAYDLGGSDRDIHIARSSDGGATWQLWEMPSFSDDEYHPDLAVDAAGYLYVTWVRDDGTIVRSRSAGPDDPVNWAWVRGLQVGEPCATPAIAVSGAGQFSTVFIAAGWLTVNWDLLQYEWTLIWMYSTNGGDTVTYDYLVPDGYQDLWPDVALDGATAYLVNGEADIYTGRVDILLAADAISGSFLYPVSLTAWTDMSCGFPSLAADGPAVYCAFQLDYEDGLGNVDGDIIYCFSWDGLQSVYGPYELVADLDESVGPAIYTEGGRVGCLWLQAPAGGDEFDLVARQASLDGHPDYWQAVETVTDQNHVEPMFRSASGVAGTTLHAAWIDRRDFPVQGLNVYTSERPARPDLEPFTPPDWSAPLVANMIPGARQTGPLPAGQPVYVSLAFVNTGLAQAQESFQVALTLDGVVEAAWVVSGGMPLGTYATVEDHVITAGQGTHTLGFRIDTLDQVSEAREDNNTWTEDFFFLEGAPLLVLSPERLIHQVPESDKAKWLPSGSYEMAPTVPRLHLPVMSERLQAAVAKAQAGERLRVVVEPTARVDAPSLAANVLSRNKAERRSELLAVLKAHAEHIRTSLSPFMTELVRRGEMSDPRNLWLTGQLVAEMTPAAVTALADRPEVGRLWLDDVTSRPCRAPQIAAAGRPPAAVSPEAEALRQDGGWGPTRQAGAGKSLAWHLPQIEADQAWAAGYDGTGSVVGHLDTGAAYDHPDLAGQLWDGGPGFPHHGWDSLDEDDDPYDGDSPYWHGTHTAGLIAGDGTGGTATGVAPGTRLMILRCVPGYYEDMVEAMQFGLDHGADILTTSAGWAEPPEALREANRANAEILLAVGIPWICAAGNGDHAGGHYPVPYDIVSPADCPHPWYGDGGHSAVIAVGATTALDLMWSASGLGPTAWNLPPPSSYGDYPYPPGLVKPDLAAPGVDITSTFGPSGYYVYSGTSMAAPLVAGAAAILLQAAPDLTPAELGRVLEISAVDLAPAERDNQAGAGRVAIAAALAELAASATESFWVHNAGPLTLQVSGVVWDVPWLQITPTSAAVAPGDSARFVAAFDATGLGTGAYHTEVTLTSNDPLSPHILPVTLIVGDMTDVRDGDESGTLLPVTQPALRNHPNPFNPQTLLQFRTVVAGPVRLEIYDLQGRRVRLLIDEVLPADHHERGWDGRDDAGQALASGTYLARLLRPEGSAAVRKLTLVR